MTQIHFRGRLDGSASCYAFVLSIATDFRILPETSSLAAAAAPAVSN